MLGSVQTLPYCSKILKDLSLEFFTVANRGKLNKNGTHMETIEFDSLIHNFFLFKTKYPKCLFFPVDGTYYWPLSYVQYKILWRKVKEDKDNNRYTNLR